MRLKRDNQGFTLIEVLIYLFLISIILMAVAVLLFWALRSNTRVRAASETIDNARSAIQVMTREIRAAEGVYTPTMTGSTQLSLETKNNLPPGETSTYIDFFLCGTQLCFKRESQNPIALTSENVSVTSVDFSRIVTGSTSSIQIILQVEFNNPDNRPELEASIDTTTVVSLRSY